MNKLSYHIISFYLIISRMYINVKTVGALATDETLLGHSLPNKHNKSENKHYACFEAHFELMLMAKKISLNFFLNCFLMLASVATFLCWPS